MNRPANRPRTKAELLRAAAYHEAGHAVIGWRRHNWIRERGVSIDLQTPGNGSTHIRAQVVPEFVTAYGKDPDSLEMCCQVATVEDEVAGLLAGPMAEMRYLGQRMGSAVLVSAPGGYPDLDRARALLNALVPGDSHWYVWMLQEEVKRMLREPRTWRAISIMARHLAVSGHVSAEEADRIIARYRVPRSRFPRSVMEIRRAELAAARKQAQTKSKPERQS